MSAKNKRYLALNLTLAVALLLSLGTGLAWLLSEGGRGGSALLGVARRDWRDLHIWFSLVMIAGTVVHLVWHWEWIVAMTRRLFQGRVKKAHGNYVLDGALGLILVLATATGLPFLLAGGGGYQGGRNPAYRAVLLGLERGVLSDLHTWLGLGFLAVLVLHLALHWNWIRHALGRPARPRSAELCPSEAVIRADE